MPVRRGPSRGGAARFGDYGVQSGDGTATISSDEMRSHLTENLESFLTAG